MKKFTFIIAIKIFLLSLSACQENSGFSSPAVCQEFMQDKKKIFDAGANFHFALILDNKSDLKKYADEEEKLCSEKINSLDDDLVCEDKDSAGNISEHKVIDEKNKCSDVSQKYNNALYVLALPQDSDKNCEEVFAARHKYLGDESAANLKALCDDLKAKSLGGTSDKQCLFLDPTHKNVVLRDSYFNLRKKVKCP